MKAHSSIFIMCLQLILYLKLFIWLFQFEKSSVCVHQNAVRFFSFMWQEYQRCTPGGEGVGGITKQPNPCQT